MGITLNLAPVADVNTNPLNPVIGVRSFGSDPALVSRHVAAFVTGLQAGGVAACAKHFPGHGATDVDSHLDLPVVSATREELLARSSSLPFRAAIAAGTRAIMSAHLVVPAIDSVPATLSHAQLTGLLRDELGFTRHDRHRRARDEGRQRDRGDGGGRRSGPARRRRRALPRPRHRRGPRAASGAAIVAAVEKAARRRPGLAEAAGRVAASTCRSSAPRADAPAFAELGLAAARRALHARATVGCTAAAARRSSSRARLSVAAGPPSHDLASILARAWRRRRGDPDHGEHRLGQRVEPSGAHPGRRPVVVVRDVDRHPWQRGGCRRDPRGRPASGVVVDVGYPAAALPAALPARSRRSASGAPA